MVAAVAFARLVPRSAESVQPNTASQSHGDTAFVWEAGSTNGLSFVATIYGARASTNDTPYAGRARITIDADGRITRVEAFPARADGTK